ncbi:MAG TPA: head GIN domain-containing protein, partial [Yeosuana sp.]
SAFNKVSIEGVFEVTITQGDTQSVEIIADDNIMHKVITRVLNNELRLYLDDDNNYRNISLKANITVPVITGLKNSGAGNVLILNVENGSDFNLFNSGSGDISIEGSAQSLSLKNEGSGTFEGFSFSVYDCNIKIIGSGDCKVHCTNNLNAKIEGSGDVHYLGSPAIEADISGSGKIVNAN